MAPKIESIRLSREDKRKIIEMLEKKRRLGRTILSRESDKMSLQCEQKMIRRLNNVSAALWGIKLKDALDVERRHKPSIKSLLHDVKKLNEGTGVSPSRP